MQADEALVEITGLRKSYREANRLRVVIDDLDLQVAAGEQVALLGRSGCGKSTLLNLIGGIDHADAGRIAIGGQDLTRLSEAARTRFRRRHIGFVYQFFNLIPTLTALENLCLPLELNGVAAVAARERAAEWLQRVGLDGRGGAFPDRLSGGEQQRVALARALIHRPRLVLADEPTGNLDAENGRRIAALLRDSALATGATVLLVTHSADMATGADRVLRLEDGRLAPAAEAPA